MGKIYHMLLGTNLNDVTKSDIIDTEFDSGSFNSVFVRSKAEKICDIRPALISIPLLGLGRKEKDVVMLDEMCDMALKIGTQGFIDIAPYVAHDDDLFPPEYIENVKKQGGSRDDLFDLLLGAKEMQAHDIKLRPLMSHDVDKSIILPEKNLKGTEIIEWKDPSGMS